MSIRNFFTDKEILLTGATGLVGTALLEKVIRDLPELRMIHVLIRPKYSRRGMMSSEQRFQKEVIQSSAFDRLRETHGEGFDALVNKKISVVDGDLSQPDLGMSELDRQDLQSRIHGIINCAAVVSFDAPIDSAIELNTFGPVRILEFARGCSNPFFAHVSTCYVNDTQKGIAKEGILDPNKDLIGDSMGSREPYDVEREIENISNLIEGIRKSSRSLWRRAGFFAKARFGTNIRSRSGRNIGSESAGLLADDWIRRRLIDAGLNKARDRGWNDVYTFTKAMGEQLLAKKSGDVPTLIFRPSIIESAFDEPISGWLEGFRMIDPLIVAYGRGQLPDFPGDPDSIIDLVPVDKVVNALLAAIPTVENRTTPVVYQLATGQDNKLTFGDFCGLVRDHLNEEPLSGRVGYVEQLPPITFPSINEFLNRLRPWYLSLLPAFDAALFMFSIIPWVKRYRDTMRSRLASLERLMTWAQIYSPYSNSHRTYECTNMWNVLHQLPDDERATFDFNVKAIDWKHYIQDIHIPGIRKFLLGVTPRMENPSDKLPRRQLLITDIPDDVAVQRQLGSEWLWKPVRKMTRWIWAMGYKYYLGFQYEGLEEVPMTGPFIVASNHNSHLDTGALLVVLTKDDRCLHPVAAKDYWFRNKFSSWVSRTFIDAIPFDRQAHFAQSLGMAIALLRKEHSLLFFPEGGRSTTGGIRAFKPGLGVMALESGAPIVPANISGSFQAMSKGRWIPKRHNIKVRFGSPIQVDPYMEKRGTLDTVDLARKITEDVQSAVEGLS